MMDFASSGSHPATFSLNFTKAVPRQPLRLLADLHQLLLRATSYSPSNQEVALSIPMCLIFPTAVATQSANYFLSSIAVVVAQILQILQIRFC